MYLTGGNFEENNPHSVKEICQLIWGTDTAPERFRVETLDTTRHYRTLTGPGWYNDRTVTIVSLTKYDNEVSESWRFATEPGDYFVNADEGVANMKAWVEARLAFRW